MIEQRIQDILREKAALDEELQTIRKGLVGKKVKFAGRRYLGNDKWQKTVKEGIITQWDNETVYIQSKVMCYRKIEDIIEIMEK